MLPNSKVFDFRLSVRLMLAVMVAVIASMTLHHGAMAHVPTDHGHVGTIDYRAQDTDCKSGCATHAHLFSACCGMGLCLSGLPAAPQSSVPAVTDAPSGRASGIPSSMVRQPN